MKVQYMIQQNNMMKMNQKKNLKKKIKMIQLFNNYFIH